MKTKIRAVAAAVAISIAGLSYQANATGIPTVDMAAIAQAITDAIQQAAEAAEQLSAAQDQISELKQQYDQAERQFEDLKNMTTGNSRYGSTFYDPDLYEYIPTSTTAGSWEQIYTNMDQVQLKQARSEYGMESDNPLQQEVFDKQLTNMKTAEGAYRANNVRLENLQKLQADADAATTPQQKQDIANRLAVEQASIQNEANRLSTTKDIMERQDKLLAAKQNSDFETFLNGQ